MRRLDCHNRIKQVRSSLETALQSVTVLIRIAEEQPTILHEHDLDLSDLRALIRELPIVYFVRMFASFESSLRHYWITKVRETKPITEVLLNSIAGRLGVPQDNLDSVHQVRNFRNSLIHEDHLESKRFTFEEASGIVNKYLARLPLEW